MPERDLTQRINALPPERRKLLAELLDRKTASTPAVPASSVPQPAAALEIGEGLDDSKAVCRKFYDSLSMQLDAGVFGEFSFFLNYGYVADRSAEYSPIDLPRQYINRNSAKLVLELIGDCAINGCRILDVGCGRGGTIHMLTQFFSPAFVFGIDLSPAAIGFCRRAHRDRRVRLAVGDAEILPFSEGAFEVVTNLESSSCYPDLFAFYEEVHRVLAPGGYFLYSDCLPQERMTEAIRFLTAGGFQLERDRDITNNVCLSCDEISRVRLQAYGGAAAPSEMENFLAAPGSEYYEEMREGAWTYRILKLRKREQAA
jgi:SAM-dependent methyltransferase